ncbi:class II aldolase/adducin family protein [Rubrimonas cliftonensis]|uniref:Rhamnose utilisation protein RhaD, predicted bifunctional aldolase and dehydrogenase n=1 Tax=Rubrimonas cliftonensis TaxID=89524 RepID=A0A1H4C444_9RHOB|nr:class II aldolase/adducin family protein [Rubrimonas cliftonensis]SEA55120.1 Rhamnose utilisation protein RhaD, predicted bifunctional aldolase and dehydrogenase [Rubrimonas cliftonensis]
MSAAERFAALRADPAFARLRAVSARLGADPLQVQGAGGNTSFKRGDAMLIKASGLWLAEAEARDVFVPVDLAGLRAAVARDDPGAEAALAQVPPEANPGGLRPSIETTVHAVCPAPVVLHTHCVATIAAAMRADGEAVAMAALDGLGAMWVPYVKPGLRLAREIAGRLRPDTRLIVLGNHGIVACADDAGEGESLLAEAAARLAAPLAFGGAAPAPGLAEALRDVDYRPLDAPATQALARDATRLARAAAGSFWPDHVIFLGRGLACAAPGETAAQAAARLGRPALLFLPGLGAAMREDASAGAQALAACVGDVFARVADGAPLRPFTATEEDALLNWDAEKYRQSLDAGGAA